MTNNSGQDETIEVRRRRQGASSGPSGRADAPVRRRDSGTPGGGGPGGGSGGGSGGNPVTRMPLWLVILLVIGYGLYSLLSGGQSEDTNSQPTQAPFVEQATEPAVMPEEATATPRAKTKVAPAQSGAGSSSGGQKWTVMLYQDADDQILEQDIYMDLNEVERVGSSDQVQIVSQIDRYKGAFTGDGNWTDTRRYHIVKDDDLSRVRSELVDQPGELDMADGKTLVDFVTWAAKTYPADHYVLILSDHGMGWPGGMSDPAPAVKDASRAPLASALDSDNLYLMELDRALATIQKNGVLDQFEMIGMDACLMSHLEVISALQPYARYAVLSQETEPALGWAYTSFLQDLVDHPELSGAELSKAVVSSYIQDDQRIVDDQARADFLRESGGSRASAAALANELGRDVTLTAVDLSAAPALVKGVNDLAYALQSEDQQLVASARTYAPSFTNVFGSGRSPYIDLGSFVQILGKQGASAKTVQAGNEVLSALKSAVVAEKHGSGKKGATGVSIYFPTSTLYRSPVAGAQSYTAIADRFAKTSLWDDFLAFHYNDIGFKPDAAQPVTPKSGAPSRAPGLGQIKFSAIKQSGGPAAPNSPVTLTARVQGSNIGYIYLFAGYYDRASNAIFEADTDYLESAKSQQVNGVYYPVWSTSGSFNLKLDWEPTLFQISDGEKTTVALLKPQVYGASAQDAEYTVDGIYHYTDGTDRSARLIFRDGQLRQVFGYTDPDQTGGVREILPQPGDTFTILENWLDLDSSGNVTQSATQEGETLTFGDQPFTWKEVYAAPGDYIVGFIVTDLDGNATHAYTQVTVQ